MILIKNTLFLVILSLALFACGNNDESAKDIFQAVNTVKTYKTDTVLSGTVSNNEGTVNNAKIIVSNSQGTVIASSQLKNQDGYRVTIAKGTQLPLVVTARPQDGSEALMVAIIDPGMKKNDISVLTSNIAKKAKELGGYTYANMSQAAMSSTSVPRSNQTSGGFSGDPTRQYGGWH